MDISNSNDNSNDNTIETTEINPYPDENFRILIKKDSDGTPTAKREITELLDLHDILIIVAGTGSGKTTQIPQFFYNNPNYAQKKIKIYKKGERIIDQKGKRIIISIPKKISTVSTAKFVATQIAQKEFYAKNNRYYKQKHIKDAEKFGLQNFVGYSVRDNTCRNDKTVVEYMTDGMVINEFQKDPNLSDISLILLDEVHERTVGNDILMGLIPEVIKNRKENNLEPLKCIIMSATLDEDLFLKHFRNFGEGIRVYEKIYRVPGKQNEVITCYSPPQTNNILIDTIAIVHDIHNKENVKNMPELSILVFLTTPKEITDFCNLLNSYNDDMNIHNMNVLPLHASLNYTDQQAATDSEMKDNKRKVIVSTNYAEASVTIPNLFFVIDSGFALETKYDATLNLHGLIKSHIDKAAADQRQGRAGREFKDIPQELKEQKKKFYDFQKNTQHIPGVCFRVYPRERFNNEFKKTSDPKILREEISSHYLFLKTLNKDPEKFMWMQDPSEEQFLRAVQILQDLGALDTEKNITNKGKAMARFVSLKPIHSAILLSSFKYNCKNKALSLVAILSTVEKFDKLYIKDPNFSNFTKEQKTEYTTKQNQRLDALLALEDNDEKKIIMSDHIKVLAIYEAYSRIKNMKDINKRNYKKELLDETKEEVENELMEKIINDLGEDTLNNMLEVEENLEQFKKEFQEEVQKELKIKLEDKSEELASNKITKWCEERYLNEETLKLISIQRKKILKIFTDICLENSIGEEEIDVKIKKKIIQSIDNDGTNDGYNSIIKCMLHGFFLNIAKWSDKDRKYEVINMSGLPQESLAMPSFESLVSRFPKDRKKQKEKPIYPKYICYDKFMYFENPNVNLLDNKDNVEQSKKILSNCSEVNIDDLLTAAPNNYFKDYMTVSAAEKSTTSTDQKAATDRINDRINDLLKNQFNNLEVLRINSDDNNSQFKALAYQLTGDMNKFPIIKSRIFTEINNNLLKYNITDAANVNKYNYDNSSAEFLNVKGDLRTLQAAASIYKKKIINFLYKKGNDNEKESLDYEVISPRIETLSSWEPFQIIYICKDERGTYNPVISTADTEIEKLLNDSNIYHSLSITPRRDRSLSSDDTELDELGVIANDRAMNEFDITNYGYKSNLELLFEWPGNNIILLDTYQGKNKLTTNGCILLTMIISATYIFEGIDITQERIKKIINTDAPNIISKLEDKKVYTPGIFYIQDQIYDIINTYIKNFNDLPFPRNTKYNFSDLTLDISGYDIFNANHIENMMTIMKDAYSPNKKVGCSFQYCNQVAHAITILYEYPDNWIIIDTLNSEPLIKTDDDDKRLSSGTTMTRCKGSLTLHTYLMYYLTNKLSKSKNANHKIKFVKDREQDPMYITHTHDDVRNFSAYIFSLPFDANY